MIVVCNLQIFNLLKYVPSALCTV